MGALQAHVVGRKEQALFGERRRFLLTGLEAAPEEGRVGRR